jgi:Cu(I)/Ag(I) efflux system membrane fusion protein
MQTAPKSICVNFVGKFLKMRTLIWLCLLICFTSCGTFDKKEAGREVKPLPAAIYGDSDTFQTALLQVLDQYDSLKTRFRNENIKAIDLVAKTLKPLVDSLPIEKLQADSNLKNTANTYLLGISAEIQGLLGEKELTAKRRSFQMITDQLYDLIRTVQYRLQVVYHIYCADAFEDQGAFWLSRANEQENPYHSIKVSSNGVLKDSIDFRKPK